MSPALTLATLQVRVVIWRTKNIKIPIGEAVNIQISTEMDCEEYLGDREPFVPDRRRRRPSL